LLPSEPADLKLFFLLYHMDLDYFCCPGVSAIWNISVLLLLSLCERLPIFNFAVPHHSQKTLFTWITDAPSAIGLLIESCPLSMQQVKIPNALVEICLAFLKSRGIR